MIFSRLQKSLARTVIPLTFKPRSNLLFTPLRSYTVFDSKKFFSTEAKAVDESVRKETCENQEEKKEEKKKEEKKEEDPRDIEIKV